MSIELFIQGFDNGAPAGLPVDTILGAFGLVSRDNTDRRFWLDYGPGATCEMVMDVKSGVVTAITILRPVTASGLWSSVFNVLSIGPYVAYSYDGLAAYVREEVPEDMPSDMVESLEIGRVASPDELTSFLFS